MINLLHYCNNVHHICFSCGFQLDLQWWRAFATTWYGTLYLAANTTAQFASDASSTWGLVRDFVVTVTMGHAGP